MIDPLSYFSSIRVVTLRRTPQRYAAFQERIAKCGWPFGEIVPFDAIDGRLCPKPAWWTVGDSAWGVSRSFLACIQEALNTGAERLMLMEDDAEPVENFAPQAIAFLEAMPKDAELVYLGGQVNHRPQQRIVRVNDLVIRPESVNRMHAWFMTKSGMHKVYKWWHARDWQSGQHCDHHLERLSRSGQIATYAPTKWLVAQAAGFSEIYGHHMRRRMFDESGRPATVIAVVGPYRGGTSCVAGALHRLGVPMKAAADKFVQVNQRTAPKGCYEAKTLSLACQKCYPEPTFVESESRATRVRLLRDWAASRPREGAVIGAKNPKLCLMVPDTIEAWPGCKLIVVERSPADVIASLTRLGWFSDKWPPEKLARHLIDTRDAALRDVPVGQWRCVQYEYLLAHPLDELIRLAEFIGISPSPEQYERAVAFVDPTLNHAGCTTAADNTSGNLVNLNKFPEKSLQDQDLRDSASGVFSPPRPEDYADMPAMLEWFKHHRGHKTGAAR